MADTIGARQDGRPHQRNAVMLTAEQRAELEALGTATVRIKLVQPGAGRGAALAGFKSGIQGGHLTRGDVEDWLTEMTSQEAAAQSSTLRWARIAGWSGIAGVFVGVASIAVAIWLAK